MATSAPTRPQETWDDWFGTDAPSPIVLSRDELLEQLGHMRIDASVRDLRFWEYNGILPRPQQRLHKGRVRAVYPPQAASLVKEIRRLQRLGFSLEQVRRRARAFARHSLAIGVEAIDREIQAATGGHVEGPEDLRLSRALTEELEQLSRWHERVTGVPTDHVEVWIVDEEGNRTKYPMQIAALPDLDTG